MIRFLVTWKRAGVAHAGIYNDLDKAEALRTSLLTDDQVTDIHVTPAQMTTDHELGGVRQVGGDWEWSCCCGAVGVGCASAAAAEIAFEDHADFGRDLQNTRG